jgi:hypothetical protein
MSIAMFEQLERTSWLTPSIKSFLAQQALAFWGPLLLCLFLIGIVTKDQRYADENSSGAGLWYIFLAPCACGVAYLVRRFFPNSVRPGRWVWMLPTCWFVLVFSSELPLTRTAHPFLDNLRIYFYPTPKDFPLGILIATFPMFASCCYAMVMMISAKRIRMHV